MGRPNRVYTVEINLLRGAEGIPIARSFFVFFAAFVVQIEGVFYDSR